MGIIVEWILPAVPGTEYIDDIDLDNLDRFFNSPVRMKTEFGFPGRMGEGGEFVECVAEIRAERRAVDRVDLVMEYHKHLNQKGVDLGLLIDGSWGKKQDIHQKGTRLWGLFLGGREEEEQGEVQIQVLQILR